MEQNIFNHDTDVDVVHKYNSVELKSWMNQLEYIDSEIDKLLNLYANSIQDKEIPQNTLQLFSKRKEANKKLYQTVIAYAITYDKASECDDIQCDMAYLSEFERLRKSCQYHLERYRKLKDSLYDEALSRY
ncbi:hypothetical protein NA63_2941 [Flavobacteriaceae bacterium MAR_2010_105]|nr:hypothetical protein NA63_2941 [Flavobacteriaceae bacterium MAR_2010_105]